MLILNLFQYFSINNTKMKQTKKQHKAITVPSPEERVREKIKICGMKYPDNITQVAALQPDYLGFIFYEKSLRNFDAKSIPDIPNTIKKVGVFVNTTIDFVIEKIHTHHLQAVQLHGEETPEYCSTLRTRYAKTISASYYKSPKKHQNPKNLELIKVFSIKNEFNFEVLKPYENKVNYFLFDTKGKLPGGNGYTFNWDVLNNYPSTKPFFLSGGIGINEIENIKKFLQSKVSAYCYAIDVNSKFETAPGLKKIDDLKIFKNEL